VAEASAPAPPLDEVARWGGFEVDEAGGARVGRVDGVFVDAESGAPVWIAVTFARAGLLRRRRDAVAVAVPARECAGGAGRVWTALGGAALRSAPPVDPTRPLLREHEAAICAHYGIGATVGRHAEVTGRPAGSVTARPWSY
jgi:hypothetical protein